MAGFLEIMRKYSSKQSGEKPKKVHTRQLIFPTYIQYIASLDVQSKVKYIRKAGIICTIGPASRDVQTLVNMIEAGMDIARLNFSHGTHEYHKETIINIRKAVAIRSKTLKRPSQLAIALDTKGPEIRTGIFAKGVNAEEEIKRGSTMFLHTDKKYYDKGTAKEIFIDYPKLPQIVNPGSSIFIDDGLVQLKVVETDKNSIKCIVTNGGLIGSKKGVNLPGTNTDLPPISEKDKKDISFAIENDLDFIFASFIRTKEDIENIKALLTGKGESILVIAKIENHEGIDNMDDIIEASDGIMVARGDLGIEIPTEKVFLAQKRMIASCNLAGKPVICATQMLESMTKKPRPTRAESSDVANAILDGTDCVMLSGETAKGEYPVECVSMMADICRAAEAAVGHLRYFHDASRMVQAPTDTAQSLAIASVAAANKIFAAAILVTTTSGYTAFLVSKFRPPCNILAITRDPAVARKCFLYRGVIPVQHTREEIKDWSLNTEDKIRSGLEAGISRGHIHENDRVIVLTSWKQGKGNTNTMRILNVTADIMSQILKNK